MLIERQTFPRHKVCGEYLSCEVVPYLESMAVGLADAPVIRNFMLCDRQGKTICGELPLGGVGISRFALDQRLYESAQKAGVQFVFEKALDVCTTGQGATVRTTGGTYDGKVLLGAWGKRSQLDREVGREFQTRQSPWMAVKLHFRNAVFPPDQVGLFFFDGGYAGCSLTETGDLNFCFLIRKDRFREFGEPMGACRGILKENPRLTPIFRDAQPVFERPLSIAQIDFGPKERVGRHTLYLGDAAHLIHPLCGNGMAMAIHSGRLAGQLTGAYLGKQSVGFDSLAHAYKRQWEQAFSNRLRWGRILQGLLTRPHGISWALRFSGLMPALFTAAIRQTHGKTLPV